MDNITHTLVGVALAEGAVRIRASQEKRKIDPRWARYAWFFSAAANNFPDLDFLYASALGGKVGYLLHHRGHTHTFLLALPQAVLVLLLAWVVAHHRRAKFSQLDWRWMIGIIALGPFAHIGMDALNSYGVHPFWPWNNRWFYGDVLFIVEPLLWVTLAPALAWSATLGVGRGLFFGIALLGVSLSWLTPFLPRMHATFLTIVAAAVTWAFWKQTPAKRITYAGAVSLAIVLTFAFVSRETRARFRAALPAETHVHDLILTPLPANPFCWNIVSVETQDGKYRLREALFAPFGKVFRADECPRFRTGTAATLPRQLASDASTSEIRWLGEWEAPLESLRALQMNHCGFAAFSRFSRSPFAFPVDQDIVVGDARYDREKELGFSEFVFPQSLDRCPANIPPWDPPRADIFSTR